jgi:pimeloyl-ACP methyl ester carboxylesterase
VLFVHGLWLSGAESFLLRRRLAAGGWRLRVVPFSSLGEPPDTIARRCAREAQRIADRTALPVHLLGHSLGGLIIYRMFEQKLLAADRFSGSFCRVVFLGSPVAGTRSGLALARWRHGRRMLGQAARELLDSPRREWRFAAQLGVIAGNRPLGLGRILTELDGENDGTVAVAETRLPGMHDHCVLPVTHTGLMWSAEVARRVARFLEHGRFDLRSRG